MMVEDCKALVKGCSRCCAFEGVIPKAPLCPMREHAPLELVHVDFTSMESTMELNKPPCVKNVLVITDHFTHYALAVVTKDQTAKTIAKVLYERFITVFGAPAKLLSDWGANFTSVLVEELCAMFSIQKCQTTVYHPQCNGQVKCFHQTLFRMIGKLASNKKAQWEQHLPELLQAYNSTRSAITSYSPHYLMFGRHPRLPVDLYFPTKGTYVCSCHIPSYVEEVRRHFKEAYTEAHLQTNSEVKQQKWYNDRPTSTVQLMPGDVILMKLDAFQGKRKAKDVKVTHCNRFFLVAPMGDAAMPLGGSKFVSYVGTVSSTLAELTPLECGGEMSGSEVEGALTWHPARHIQLGWVDGVLRLLPSVALRPTVCRLRSGDGTSSFSDNDVH